MSARVHFSPTIAYLAPRALGIPVSVLVVTVGLLVATSLFSAMAILVIVAALVSLGAAFLMAGRTRPTTRRSLPGRAALLDVVTEFERPGDSTPAPAPSTPPVVVDPDAKQLRLPAPAAPAPSDDLLSLPGLGTVDRPPLPPREGAGVTLPVANGVRPSEPSALPAPPAVVPAPVAPPAAPAATAAPAPPEPPAAPASSGLSRGAVDRHAIMRRIETLEGRSDAHSREWARRLRERIDSQLP